MDLDTISVALFPTQLAVTCSIFYSYVGEGQVSFITWIMLWVRHSQKEGMSGQVSVAWRNTKTWHCGTCHEEGMQLQCQYCHTTMPVISKTIGCVLFVSLACNCQGCLAHKSVLALVWISTDHVSTMEGIEGSPIWLVLPMFRWCPQKPVIMTRCSFHP